MPGTRPHRSTTSRPPGSPTGGASQSTRSAKDELTALLETIPVGVFIMDASGAVVRSNARATEIWGGEPPAHRTGDELALYKGWKVETGEPVRTEEWAGQRAVRGETIVGEMVDIERFDGRRATILNSAAPIRDESGAVIGAVAAMLDVTDRRLRDERLQKELATARLLQDALEVLSQSLDLAEVLNRLVRIVVRMSSRPRASVFLWEEDAGLLRLTASSGDPQVPLGMVMPLKEASAFMRDAVARRSAVLADFATIPAYRRGRAREHGLVSSLIVPLSWDGVLLGVLTVDETAFDKPFDDREVKLIEGIAAQAAAAIENARLFASQRELATSSQALAQVSILVSTMDFDRAIPLVLEASCRFVRCHGAILARRVPGGWETTHRFGHDMLQLPDFFADAQAPTRSRMLETLTAQHVRDVALEPGVDVDLAQRAGYRSYVVLPLQLQDRPIGALSFYFKEPREGFSQVEWGFFERLQYIVASALENRRLFDELSRRAHYADALNRINETVHSTLAFDEIMGRVVIEATRAGGVDATAVHMYEDGHWRFSHSYGLPHELTSARLREEQAPMSMTVIRERQVLVVPDIDADPRFQATAVKAFSIRAVIAVPLFSRDQVVGVLFSGCYGGPARFDREQIDFIVKVAYTVSLALENSRLYEGEHRIAETLQQSLLALPERVRGVRFAHAYRSASEAAYVGGDFYDVFELERDMVGILVGDIAGKGLEAAALTSLLKNTIRAHAAERPASPDTVLALTNDIVRRVTPTESFATAFLGTLDTKTGELTYTNAGHPTAFIVAPGGGLTELPSNSPLIGVLEAPGFARSMARLDAGTVLVAYTDGVTEARSGKRFYGQPRVADVLSGAGSTDPAHVVRDLVDDIVHYTGNRLSDDLAILAVARELPGSGGQSAEAVPIGDPARL